VEGKGKEANTMVKREFKKKGDKLTEGKKKGGMETEITMASRRAPVG